MARIVDHLSVAELEARYRGARDVAEARHTQAIWLPARGRTFLEVAQVLAFVPRWVEELAARYNALGPAALGDRRRRNGRAASLLTEDVPAALAERVRTPPDGGGLWSGPKVAAWIARHLGPARVHPQRGREALKRIGWSLQAPRHGRGTPGGGAPRPGADRPAPDRPRPPPLPVAARRRLRAADQRRGGLVSLQRPLEALLRRTARQLRPRDRRGARAQHRPRARQCGLARSRAPGRPRRGQPRLPAALFARTPARRASLAPGG